MSGQESASGGLKPYPAYKDSGVPWLGQVPEHWQVLPGRACFREKYVRNAGLLESQVLSLSFGRIIVKPNEALHGLVPESFETYQIIDPGDIVVRPTDLQNDQHSLRFGISSYRGIITSAYLCFESTPPLSQKFGYLMLDGYDRLKVFYSLGSGLRQNLAWSDFKYLPCVRPPQSEQAGIVRYLAHMDRQIRQYIRVKQKLIKLLEEQKQTIIQQAVTRGLDPNVRLKPSGVEWLGDVPEHWEVRRLRWVAEMFVSSVDKHSHEGEHAVRLCNYVDVYKNERIHDRLTFMTATATREEIERFKIRIGDVLITKDSEDWRDIGVPSLVEYSAPDLVCGYHLAILRPRQDKITGSFLLRIMESPQFSYQFNVAANGVTRYGLSHGSIKSAIIVRPPLHEQGRIVDYLENIVPRISGLVARIQNELPYLRELRTRLIADIVTGKVDVRQVASDLTEENEEFEQFEETEEPGPADDISVDGEGDVLSGEDEP